MRDGIYIKRLLATAAEIERFAAGLDMIRPQDPPHITLIYSKAAVDWSDPIFLPRQDYVSISPTGARLDRFGDHLVIKLQAPELHERFDELVRAGAVSDHSNFQPHITIGRDPDAKVDLDRPVDLRHTLILGAELRKVPKECRGGSVEVPELRSTYTRGHRNDPARGAVAQK